MKHNETEKIVFSIFTVISIISIIYLYLAYFNLSDFYVLINPANHFIGYTMDYDGTITIAGKGDDYVILHFNKVKWSLSPWEYTTDGYLYCTLEDMLTI